MIAETIERDGVKYLRAGIVVDDVVYMPEQDASFMANSIALALRRQYQSLSNLGHTGPDLVEPKKNARFWAFLTCPDISSGTSVGLVTETTIANSDYLRIELPAFGHDIPARTIYARPERIAIIEICTEESAQAWIKKHWG